MNANTDTSDTFLGDLPTSDRRLRWVGFLIVFVTFGVFGVWATFAPLGSAALAPGVVTVQSYRKTLQHLEGGIVKELLARDGDSVSAGAPLILLDDTQIRAEYDIIRSQLVAAQATEARLQAERDGLEQIDFSAMLESRSQRSEEAREGEIRVFNARRGSHLGETQLLGKRISQLHQQIAGLQSMIATKRGLEKSYRGEIAELTELLAEGYVDKQRLLEQERALEMLRAEIAAHQSDITGMQLQIGETELQVLQLNKDFNAEVAAQLAEVQTRSFDLEERMAALQARLERVVIRAPVDGMILGMTVHTVGGVVSAGTPLLDIVPSVTGLIVEAQVSPVDIARVQAGKPADIRFSAFNSATTPVIRGEVEHVSADRLINKDNGMPYYLARIRLTEQGAAALGDLKLQPGMPAEVLINTGERTMLEYLLQPATDAVARAMIEQ